MFSNKNKYLSLMMWLLPTSFFAYQFILRLWPSLLMQPLMQKFGIDATAFGVLASAYYYGYAGMQIPMAFLFERYGARVVMAFSAALCGLSMFVFSHTDNWYLALLSRFLVGAGSAAGFLGASKMITQYFSKEGYARMVGYTFTLGLLGAIYGGKPVSLLVEKFGWQVVAIGLGSVSLLIAGLCGLFLKEPHEAQEPVKDEAKITLGDFKSLLLNPLVWVLGIGNLLMVGSLEGFADVWGVNYLMTAYSLNKGDAAQLVSFIFVGMLFGGPLLAWFSKKCGQAWVIVACGLGLAFLLCELVMAEAFRETVSLWVLGLLFFAVGIFCCYQVIVFALGRNFVEARLLGVTVAFLNGINMLGGSFFHTLIGLQMDAAWAGEVQEGLRVYSLSAYNDALLIIPLCALVGAGMVGLLGLRVRV